MDRLTQKLTQQIDRALYLWESITLKELSEFYPISGLAEIYTYLKIAYDRPNHKVSLGKETFTIEGDNPAKNRKVTMPIVTFFRQDAFSNVPSEKLSFAVALSMVTQPLQIETASLAS
jgi:hypothetical protein